MMDQEEKNDDNRKPLALKAPPLVSAYFGATLPEVPKQPNYTPDVLKTRLKRPIKAYMNDILKTIAANRLSLIMGSSGIGKTTQIPQYLLDEATSAGQRVRIVCAVPHRLQAAAVAEVVANERQEKIGDTVGFHSLLETCVSPSETLLTYTTYEALLRAFTTASNFALESSTHMVVDEIQELNPYAELLLFYLVNALSEFPALNVVVVTSGTIDQSKLIQHLTTLRQTCISTLAIPIKMQRCRIYYLPKLPIPKDTAFEMLIRKAEDEDEEDDYEMAPCLNLEMIIGYVYYLHCLPQLPKSETMLVFLPDYSSLVRLKRMILYHSTKRLPDASFGVHLLHSATKTKDYKKILVSEPHGRRKIILATAIAENCLGFQADIVIDTGKIRRELIVGAGQKSFMYWISKTSANQRARRGGKCFRLYTYSCYKNMMNIHSLPGIRYPTINKLAMYGSCLLKDKYDAFTRFMQPISKNIIAEAYRLMFKQNVLDVTVKITKLGIMAMNFPIDPCYTRALIHGVTLRCLDPVLTVIAGMCLRDNYLVTDDDLSAIQRPRKIENAEAGMSAFSDHLALITAYKEWEDVLCTGSYFPSETEFDMVAMFDLLHSLRSSLVSQLRACGYIQPKGPADLNELNKYSNNWPIVKAVFLTAVLPHVVTAHSTEDKLLGTFCNCTSSIELHPGSVLSLSTYFKKYRECWIVFDELAPAVGHNSFDIRGCTLVTLLSLCIFAQDADLANIFWNDLLLKKVNEGSLFNVSLDDLFGLKNGVQTLVQKQINEPGREYNKADTEFLAFLVKLITREDEKFGILLPEDQLDFGSGHGRLGGGDLL